MAAHRELTPDDVLAILRRRFWWILVPSIIFPIAAYLFSMTLPYKYTSTTLVLVEQQKVPESFVKSVVTDPLQTRLATMQEQILSRTRLQPIIERFGLYKDDVGKVPMEDLVDRVRKAISVAPVRGADFGVGFYISFTADNPRLAQQVCAEITSMFMEENLKIREQHAQGAVDFLANQLDDAQRRLNEQDAKLAEFKKKYMGQLPGQEQNNLALLNTYNSQLEAVTQQLSRGQQDRAFLASAIAQQAEAWKSQQATPQGALPTTAVTNLQKDIDTAQQNLVELQSRYTDDYPDIIKTKHQIAELQKKLDESKKVTQTASATPTDTKARPEPKELQNLRLQLRFMDDSLREKAQQQARLAALIRDYQAKLQMSPAVEEQFKALTRDHDTSLTAYQSLLAKKNDSEMATDLERRQQGEQFRVMDPPNLPEKPTFPNKPLFAGGGLAIGLAVGIGFAFLFEMRDKSIRTERDVEFYLQLPTLALMPWVLQPGTPAVASPNGDGRASRLMFWKRKKAGQKAEAEKAQAVGA